MPDMPFSPTTSPAPSRQFAVPTWQHISLGAPVRGLLWLVLTGAGVIIGYLVVGSFTPLLIVLLIIYGFLVRFVLSGIRVAAQWERGILLRLGSFQAVKGPGLIYVVPVLDYIRFVDTRTLVLNIPRQRVITRDNVPAEIDGAVFFRIADPEAAITQVQEYPFAISQTAQGAMRDVVGGLTLDELLTEREQIQLRIGEIVEKHIVVWGLHIESIRLLDIELPEDLKRMMSRQASAEREKRATITKAEGDKDAAVNLAAAAATMLQSPGAMQLRSLQTIDGLGPNPSNTVVLFPIEWSHLLKTFTAKDDPEEKG